MSSLLNLPGKVISGVAGGIGDVVGGLASALFGATSSIQAQIAPPAAAAAPVTPPTVAAEAVPVMPLPDDKAVIMQKKRSLAALVKTRGRASTILTSDGALGAPPEALGG